MNIEVVWSGRGSLPYPPGRSEADDIRYQQRNPPEEVEPTPNRPKRKLRQVQTVFTAKKCVQCCTRMVSAGEARKGNSRCKECRTHTPRRGGEGRRKAKV